MLRMIAIGKLLAQGLTREEARAVLSDITEQTELKCIYSIRIDNKTHRVKVELTSLSPEELYKEAFLNMISNYMEEHEDEYIKDPARAAKLLKAKVDMLEIEACREGYLED